MKLILLAAGKSSRIYRKLGKHKCLLKIRNKTLIEKIIDDARSCGLKKIDRKVIAKIYHRSQVDH